VALTAPRDGEGFLEDLLRFGERSPGHVLYATSDDLVWLYSLYAAQLKRNFKLYQPGPATLYRLLNKRELLEACRAVGLEMPQTWTPDDEAGVAQAAREARFPVILKPQTQVFFDTYLKGVQVDTAAELPARYRAFRAENAHHALLRRHDPQVDWPLIQQFHFDAAQSIYSLSGFVDERFDFAVRASLKVLQRPRRIGIGLCFASAPLDEALVQRVIALCRHVGYHGVFEAEFIRSGDRRLLIDFNSRFFNQMGFDVARGVELPLLAYWAALGRVDTVRSMLESARASNGEQRIYCHRFLLQVLLRSQGLSGRMSSEEIAHWRSWYASNPRPVDAVDDAADWLPSLIDRGYHLISYARHPRAFIRSVALDS
jgi:predicted ATP-grasp superfamily ATP-dependent carboligase